jgi:hypothetical protein
MPILVSEVVAGGIYATENNQERRVVRIENDHVIYESRGGNVQNEWSPGHTLANPPSIENFAAACSRVISTP